MKTATNVEIIEHYGKCKYGGDFYAETVGGKCVVRIIHQPAKFVSAEWRNPKCGCPVYLIREKTKAFTIPEQYRVVICDQTDGGIVWEDRRRFLDYHRAVAAACRKAHRGT